MRSCNLPTHSECLELLDEYYVPANIRSHSRAVAKLAVFLAERLRDNGIAVDVELVEKASLLHDLLRTCDFTDCDYEKFARALPPQARQKLNRIRQRAGRCRHEEAAYDLLEDEYPVLARTIKSHKYVSLLDENEKPRTWEEKLVYYADKRVMSDRIVTLRQRLDEAHRRNIHLHGSKTESKASAARVDRLIAEMEKEIFDRLGIDPLDVTDKFINSYDQANGRT